MPAVSVAAAVRAKPGERRSLRMGRMMLRWWTGRQSRFGRCGPVHSGTLTRMAARRQASPRGGRVPIVAVDPARPLPLYEQVYEAVREQIVARGLRAGTRLASTRVLATE